MTATYVAAAAGESLLVEIETATVGTYAAPLLINLQRSLDLMATADATVIPRADNQGAPGYTSRTVTAFDWKIQGSGILNTGDDKLYGDMLLAGVAKNVRISNANTGGVVLMGLGVITSLNLSSGGIGKKVDCSITIEGAGLPTLTAHT
jgi:hypothetical protein